MGPRDVEGLLIALLPTLTLALSGCTAPNGDKTDDPVREMPGCPSETWCGTPNVAQAIGSADTALHEPCPARITAGPDFAKEHKEDEAYGDLFRTTHGVAARLDETATKTAGADSCCYTWTEPCGGGRPLMDDAGVPIVAAFRPGGTWIEGSFSIDAPAAVRARAGKQWLEDAAMEHASVASFGRVALELLSLAAPPELVRQTHQAALDEIRHAQTCLAIAVGCGAEPLQPSALPVSAPRTPDIARFAVDTFIEGCVGETTAALIMERAAAGTTDPKLRDALTQIARDEATHAALAWRTVAWAIAQGGAAVLRSIERRAADVRGRYGKPARGRTSQGGPLAEAGRLTATQQDAAKRDAWFGIIEPMLARINGGPTPC